MIQESSYWKNDLLKIADRLELRIIQTRWGEKNLYTLEKEIFLGFYSIRKLIESKKISVSVKDKVYEIREFPSKGKPESIINQFKDSGYDFNNVKTSEITISQLCNQFIHSYHFLPFLPKKHLVGFFFCSDYKRKSGIYLITIFDVVEIYRIVGKKLPKQHTFKKAKNWGDS